MEAQFLELAGNPDVIVATPGRLVHHLAEVKGFGLKTVEYVVFDEADRCAAHPPRLCHPQMTSTVPASFGSSSCGGTFLAGPLLPRSTL